MRALVDFKESFPNVHCFSTLFFEDEFEPTSAFRLLQRQVFERLPLLRRRANHHFLEARDLLLGLFRHVAGAFGSCRLSGLGGYAVIFVLRINLGLLL